MAQHAGHRGKWRYAHATCNNNNQEQHSAEAVAGDTAGHDTEAAGVHVQEAACRTWERHGEASAGTRMDKHTRGREAMRHGTASEHATLTTRRWQEMDCVESSIVTPTHTHTHMLQTVSQLAAGYLRGWVLRKQTISLHPEFVGYEYSREKVRRCFAKLMLRIGYLVSECGKGKETTSFFVFLF